MPREAISCSSPETLQGNFCANDAGFECLQMELVTNDNVESGLKPARWGAP
jgi:hypothetical protein